MNKILCVGESIIDFISTENGKKLCDVKTFKKKAGGSSSNVAVGLSRFKVPALFTGIVGNDSFGSFLLQHLIKNNIDCKLLKKSNKYKTPIVFVSLDENGENYFEFYRDFRLHEKYKITNTDLNYINDIKFLHFSSVILKTDNFKVQIMKLIKKIKLQNKGIVHFDTNIRFSLWDNKTELKKIVKQFIKLSDIIKFSEQELRFIFGNKSIEKILLQKKILKNKFVIVTLGKAGCVYKHKNKVYSVKTQKVVPVDTTGAGDSFVAGFIFKLIKNNIENFNDLLDYNINTVKQWIEFANVCGTINSMYRGATAGMFNENMLIQKIKELNFEFRCL
jgi:fructokinase